MKWLKTLIYIATLRCEEADRIRSIARTEDLTRAQIAAERFHRFLCNNCRKAKAQLDRLDRVLGSIRGVSTSGWQEKRRHRVERVFCSCCRVEEKE